MTAPLDLDAMLARREASGLGQLGVHDRHHEEATVCREHPEDGASGGECDVLLTFAPNVVDADAIEYLCDLHNEIAPDLVAECRAMRALLATGETRINAILGNIDTHCEDGYPTRGEIEMVLRALRGAEGEAKS